MKVGAALPAVVLAVAFALAPVGARSTELRISYPAVERLVVSTLLTQGGRLYLQGAPGETCNFAFVQEPKASGAGGRLELRFVFSGRAGAPVGSRCVGPGATTTLEVSGVPRYDDGTLRLDGLKLRAPDSAYWSVAAGLLQGALETRLRVPLRSSVEHGLAQASASVGVQLGLDSLEVTEVAVEPDGLRLRFDWTLSAR
jgi:hypothetical protein